jgi:hypothetical protein
MEFLTPFFFSFDDDEIFNLIKELPSYASSAHNLEDPSFLDPFTQTTVNNLNLDAYKLFCLNQEVCYWIKHNTIFRYGLLRLTRDTLISYDHSIPEPIIEYGSRYMGPKIFITLIIRPLMDETTQKTLQRWIDINTDLRRKTPCLVMDSDIYIEGINKQWIADALSLVTCDPGFYGTDTLHPDKYPKLESFIIKDPWTTRLYCYLEDNFKLDTRNFNQRYNALLTSCIEQLKAMWNACFIYDYHGLMAQSWPLIPIKNELPRGPSGSEALMEVNIPSNDEILILQKQGVEFYTDPIEQQLIIEDRKPFVSRTDPNEGWYKAKEGSIIRGMNINFYLQRLQGSRNHILKVGHNYAIIQAIDKRLKESLINENLTWYFIGGYLNIEVDNYQQWEIIVDAVEQGLATTNKVVELPGNEVIINDISYNLQVIPNYEITWKVREKIEERQPDISPPK